MKSSSLMHRWLSQRRHLKPDSTHLRHYLAHPHGRIGKMERTEKKKERKKKNQVGERTSGNEREREMRPTVMHCEFALFKAPLLQNGVICRAIIRSHPRLSPSVAARQRRRFKRTATTFSSVTFCQSLAPGSRNDSCIRESLEELEWSREISSTEQPSFCF